MSAVKIPPYQGVAHLVTAQTFSSHRGSYVSIVVRLSEEGFICGLTGQPIELGGVPEQAEVSQVCEFLCYVDPSTGGLQHYRIALLDDEFDFDIYRRLVGLTQKFPELF